MADESGLPQLGLEYKLGGSSPGTGLGSLVELHMYITFLISQEYRALHLAFVDHVFWSVYYFEGKVINVSLTEMDGAKCCECQSEHSM